MTPHRLRAPSVNGGLLAEPPLDEAVSTLNQNAERLAGWDHDFQGRGAKQLRPLVRKQVLDAAKAYLAKAGLLLPISSSPEADKLVVTGHQPELFHPGVWVKNFALASVAQQAKGWGLNLVVDNDIPKATSIRVPRPNDGVVEKVERVAFDEWRGEVPYEDLTVADEAEFDSFADRVKHVLGGAVADPLIESFWPKALDYRALTDRPGLRFALARRAVEESWGVRNLEVPLSTVCETEGFLWFASHILAQLPRFQEIHNDALNRYRALYGIRSRNHPVPALGVQGEWREAPFWAWKRGDRRRRPLLVRQLAKTMELRIGDDAPLIELPLTADREACCAVEQLLTLPSRGVRLRTRALTTTMFARFVLGDLFIHGIGGAKYDELGDEISGRFFGFEPPPYLTVSMTLWLGLRDDPATPARLSGINRGLRDLTYNPDRHLPASGVNAEVERWLAAKQAAVGGPIETHAQRLDRFHEIRRCNAALQGLVSVERARLEAERERLTAGVRRNLMAHHREYSLVLHSQDRVREAFGRAISGWGSNPV